MNQKQEIYREILREALPLFRNTLSQFHQIRRCCVLSHKQQIQLQRTYEVAQFVHNLYASILEEEFTSHDIWFLNYQARSFIERNDERTCYPYPILAYYIQELFNIVPARLRGELQWDGPKGNYEWVRPKKGNEPEPISCD